MRSKEEKVLEPFFNLPKYWHFEELHRVTSISKPQLSHWLKKYEKEGIIKRMKPRGKSPHYVALEDNPDYQSKKRLYALRILAESGLLNHLIALKKAKVVILFGSFSSYYWHGESDIDIFIYGDGSEFEAGKYSAKLGRDIQVHTAKDRKDLKRIDKMLPYIIMGDFIKGSIEDLGVGISA